jgi:hypothetical protein
MKGIPSAFQRDRIGPLDLPVRLYQPADAGNVRPALHRQATADRRAPRARGARKASDPGYGRSGTPRDPATGDGYDRPGPGISGMGMAGSGFRNSTAEQ